MEAPQHEGLQAEDGRGTTEEEKDNLVRSNKKAKTGGRVLGQEKEDLERDYKSMEERGKSSYKDTVIDEGNDVQMEEGELDDEGEIFNVTQLRTKMVFGLEWE